MDLRNACVQIFYDSSKADASAKGPSLTKLQTHSSLEKLDLWLSSRGYVFLSGGMEPTAPDFHLVCVRVFVLLWVCMYGTNTCVK